MYLNHEIFSALVVQVVIKMKGNVYVLLPFHHEFIRSAQAFQRVSLFSAQKKSLLSLFFLSTDKFCQ